MSASLSPLARAGHLAGMAAALAGPPLSRRRPRPPLPPATAPQAYRLSSDITLWRLVVGSVRIRERHRALPSDLADVEDAFRFVVMMADRKLTGWLDCTAWFIETPQARLLVDTGESPEFGSTAYFAGVPGSLAYIYPRIIDAGAGAGNHFDTVLAAAGIDLARTDLCVLTHTHSDHLGNLDLLPRGLALLVSPDELRTGAQSGRLLAKLPRGGNRLRQTLPTREHEVFGPVMPLTDDGSVFVVPTPGHTTGHQSVVIDLGTHQVVLAGDAAFGDAQVDDAVVPGIVESRAMTLNTYDRLRRARLYKPTTCLFTHDPANPAKLAALART